VATVEASGQLWLGSRTRRLLGALSVKDNTDGERQVSDIASN
jgi:hypothetical protein